VPAVFRAVHRALTGHPDRLVINLDAVTFIDSVGLGALVDGYQTATALGVASSIPVMCRMRATAATEDGPMR
jgi:anti-anti-sigma regulatory factor